jgi:hypothetical protein
MTKLALVLPEVGTKNSIADPRIPTALQAIQEVVNGKLEGSEVNIRKESIDEKSLTAGVQALVNAKTSGLTLVQHKGNIEVKGGELAEMIEESATVTLPAPVLNRTVGVFGGGVAVTLTSVEKGGKIYGDFLSATGVTSIKLAPFQHVILQSEGTNWLIISGEPKREETYGAFTARVIGTEYTPSTTRPTLVNAYGGVTKGKEFIFKPTVGGVSLGGVNMNLETGELGIVFLPLTFMCGAGQKWKAEVTGTSPVLYSQYITL